MLNNRIIIISAINKKQQEWILKMGSLDGGKITVHMAKLRGVISNLPLEMSMEWKRLRKSYKVEM